MSVLIKYHSVKTLNRSFGITERCKHCVRCHSISCFFHCNSVEKDGKNLHLTSSRFKMLPIRNWFDKTAKFNSIWQYSQFLLLS